MENPSRPRQVLLYHHYDRDDIVDPYVEYALQAYADCGFDIIVTSNSALDGEQTARLSRYAREVILRKNSGYDFAAWKELLLGRDAQYWGQYDEVAIANSSCYGPLFPLREMLEQMAARNVDFWTPTRHGDATYIRGHLQPVFCLFNKKVFTSRAFREYWQSIRDEYRSMWRVITHGEIRLTTHLAKAGFSHAAYIEEYPPRNERIGHTEAFIMHGADWLIARHRLPFLKYKSFYKNEKRPFGIAQQIFRALEESGSNYPQSLIVNHLRRIAPPSWHKNLPDTLHITDDAPHGEESPAPAPKVAVSICARNRAELSRFMRYLPNLTCCFDLFVTIPNGAPEAEFIDAVQAGSVSNLSYLAVKETRDDGQDTGLWQSPFLAQYSGYDLLLNLQYPAERELRSDATLAPVCRYLLESMVGSVDCVDFIVRLFQQQARLGLFFPPLPPYRCVGKAEEFTASAEEMHTALKMLGLPRAVGESGEFPAKYVFPYGLIFWCRPAALMPLLRSDLSPLCAHFGVRTEQMLAQAPAYVAQGCGYHFRMGICRRELLDCYRMYEDRVLSNHCALSWGRLFACAGKKIYWFYVNSFPRLFRLTRTAEYYLRRLLKNAGAAVRGIVRK